MADSNWSDWVTPDLARNPGAASDVFNSGNTAQNSIVASQALKGVNTADAINDHVDDNGTQSFWSRIGGGISAGLNFLNKPLQEVQKEYKFLHAVYTDNGFLPAFVAGLGVVGGGVAGGVGGFLLGGGVGAALGAKAGIDLASTAELNLAKLFPGYKGALAKSEDPNYKVSAGRDFSNALATAAEKLGADGIAQSLKTTDKGLFGSAGSFISGITDATGDVQLDPVQIVGRFGQVMRSGGLLKDASTQLNYPLGKVVDGVQNWLTSRTNVAITSEQMDAVRKGTGIFNGAARNYNNAIEDIAQTIKDAKPTDGASAAAVAAGQIAAKYPQLGTVAAGRMASEGLESADEVHQFLKDKLYFGELNGTLAGQAMLPSRTLLRAKFTEPMQDTLKTNSLTSGVYKTFSGYMPYSVDPLTQKLSTTSFKWNAPDAAQVIYRIARFGMGDSAAREMSGKYAEAVAAGDINAARIVKNQTLVESMKAAGLADDNELVQSMLEKANTADEPLVSQQIYHTDPLGNPLGEYQAADGTTKMGGISPHHAQDTFNIPDFFAVKKQLRESGRVSKAMSSILGRDGQPTDLIGGLDEFMAKRYTDSIFKPLALATTGFGLRVAAAEMIPTFARYGIINTFKNKLAASAAKVNYDLSDGEAKHVFPAAMTALGIHLGIDPEAIKASFPAFANAKRLGLTKAAEMLAPEQMELATKLILANQGHILSEATMSGHGSDVSSAYQSHQAAHYYYQIQKNSPMFRDLPEYTTYTAESPHYVPRLATNLIQSAREAHAKNIAADFLDSVGGKTKLQLTDDIDKINDYNDYQNLRQGLIDKEYQRIMDTKAGNYKPYAEESKKLSRWVDQDPKAFAADRVDGVLGMLIGKDGSVLKNVAGDLSEGKATNLNTLANMYRKNPQTMPAAVSGPQLEPYVPTKNLLGTIANMGHQKVISPIVNNLSREPLYLVHVAEAYKKFEPLVKNGTMLEDQALRHAQTQASLSMLPQIHNTALRNQFSQLARNFLPFYFAQEQSLKRAYRTLKDTSIMSPLFSRGLRFYQLAEHALNDPAFMQQDDTGNKYITLPGGNEFGKAVQGTLSAYGMPMISGLPITARGSMTSLKSVLPEMTTPGVSPFLAVSGNAIADFFPSLRGVVQGTVGDISFQKGVLDSIVPAPWMKNLFVAGVDGKIDINNAFANAFASAAAAAYYHNQLSQTGQTPLERQADVDRIKNNARSILIVKAMLGLLSPLAPQVSQEDTGLRDEFWKLVKQKGNYADALMTFLGEHGDKAVSYTVAKTENLVPGATYPYVQKTVDFIKQHPELFTATPDQRSNISGAFYLIPQDPGKGNDRTVYNELVGMHLRANRTPDEMLKQFYISDGDAMIQKDMDTHNAIIARAKASGDTFSTQQENQRWSAVMQKMQNLYPVWYDNYNNQEGKDNANQSLLALQNIRANNLGPNNDQTKLVYSLMDDYATHAQRMNQYKELGLQGVVVNAEKQQWENHLLLVAQNEPALAPVINSVFRKLG